MKATEILEDAAEYLRIALSALSGLSALWSLVAEQDTELTDERKAAIKADIDVKRAALDAAIARAQARE